MAKNKERVSFVYIYVVWNISSAEEPGYYGLVYVNKLSGSHREMFASASKIRIWTVLPSER